MMSFFRVIAAASALLAQPALAMTMSRPIPHRTEMAICDARALVAYINSEWAYQNDQIEDFDGQLSVSELHTDSGQEWSGGDRDREFVRYVRTSNGKPDQGPITASRLVLLKSDKYFPLYLLQLRRTFWMEAIELPTMENISGYRTDDTTWIVRFMGKDISVLREADELTPLARAGRNLINQRVDCERLKRKLEPDDD